MAIKKSELYSSLWASCDELRGGMDASQYKDYVLTMLFVKYVSDKYANKSDSLIEVPAGATFEDMIALKGQPDIGDQINKKILKPLFAANGLEGSMDLVDFNDDDKLGSGNEKVELLGNLIAIFENPALDFKNNRAEDDDILGDAYEFLMRHFASESGKSKGQFYTPAEVSRILAKIIDVDKADKPSYTVYDPTCGSGSLLLKVADETEKGLTIYGQEKDIATKSLAIMNMWLHGYPEATIAGKNTIADPQFKEADGTLKRFDFVVANPPFSIKNWSNGISPMDDEFNRFRAYGVPPDKNGDYAFLLHILASMKSTGKGAVILPHGVLFRGNAEAEIRENLIDRKLIKGIIGLPANLFYGTGIPACIIVLDKENTKDRKGIFMVDASKGFIKDGNKNRLREQDLYRIVEVFNQQKETKKYARFVKFDEIVKNEYNLNIPRYIDTQKEEDIQDLNAHLNGGIPNRDVESLQAFWDVYPNLKASIFKDLREDYFQLCIDKTEIKEAIFSHAEFTNYGTQLENTFTNWQKKVYPILTGINADTAPKKLITEISQLLLEEYKGTALIDAYDIYQYLRDYWSEIMKDDAYLLVEDGWVAKTRRVIEKKKNGKELDKGWICDLLPKAYIVDAYFADNNTGIQKLEANLESLQSELSQYEEEHAVEEGLLEEAANDNGKITKATLSKRMTAIKGDASEKEAYQLMQKVQKLFTQQTAIGKQLKEKVAELDKLCYNKYPKLSEAEVRDLVIGNKWLTALKTDIQSEIDAISQRLTSRIKELAERYENTLGELDNSTKELEVKVNAHLQKIGLAW
ncbi:type I restriction-modification system subunit M [Labilibaculum sp. DW002]|uniref:site-specific DNA-methyltransferase (adenine-specific) n=1 Tax=Paralabilibaculum antarcticum TaxID=2912572 RepID=A0ABT5VSU6_9BACT|nr:type I restriction-modification system subunit M [Labilibaculum sp. DW002]MDE5418478.1 type I restriction-modification system subunit M [Labilibaculum sp. DW002]